MQETLTIVAVGLLAAGTCSGGYVYDVSLIGGDEQLFVPGDTFQLELSLNSTEGDEHNSSLFSLIFTEAGLLYEGYTWSAPYENESFFDFSMPLYSDLPAVIDADSVPGPLVDVVLSNVVPSGTFGSGVVVTLDLRVPEDWSDETTVFALPQVDTVANGFEVIEVETGPAVAIQIVPGAGAGLGLAGFCFSLMTPRRRREAGGAPSGSNARPAGHRSTTR